MEYRDYEPYITKAVRNQRARVYAQTGLVLDEAELLSDFNMDFLMASKSWQEDGSATFTTYLTRCMLNTVSRHRRSAIERLASTADVDLELLPDSQAHLEPFALVAVREAVDVMGGQTRRVLESLVAPPSLSCQLKGGNRKDWAKWEVEALTGMTTDAVGYRIKKAKKKLRNSLNFACNQ
jgi:hypothetical protein